MCAIAGIIHRGVLPPGAKRVVGRMLLEMRQRGPDGSRVLVDGTAALGHNRLAIVGSPGTVQPIASNHVAVIVNGEIYNWKELRQRVPGWKWKTDCDSEVLIPLYIKYGIDQTLSMLEGEFAFVLHDGRNRVSYAVRDRFGVKPLFFMPGPLGDSVAFASELKAFKAFTRRMDFNPYVLATCLAMHYPPLGDTIVSRVSSVAPGSYVRVEDGVVTGSVTWWRPVFPEYKAQMSMADAQEALRCAFTDAVKKRIPDRDFWCTSLSGGFDSSAVLGVAARLATCRPECFTVSFPDAGGSVYDELAVARRTAEFNGAGLTEVEMTAGKILDALPSAIRAGEGFCVNGHVACKYALAAAMRAAGKKVALVGEGADECMFGYSHLKVDMFGDGGSRLMLGTETPVGDMLRLDSFKAFPYIPSFIKAKLSSGKRMLRLLTRDFRHFVEHPPLDGVAKDMLRAMEGGRDTAEKTVCAWLATVFPSYICRVLGDGCEMASSIEGRLPFLDAGLWQIAASLPTSMKMNLASEKIAMRAALRDFVTDEVRRRPKQPFQAPPVSALCADRQWRAFVDSVTETPDAVPGIVDNIKLRKFMLGVKRHSVEQQAVDEPVWMLLASWKFLSEGLFGGR